jgi:hypothetical protein
MSLIVRQASRPDHIDVQEELAESPGVGGEDGIRQAMRPGAEDRLSQRFTSATAALRTGICASPDYS